MRYRVTARTATRTHVSTTEAGSHDEARHRTRDMLVARDPRWRAASFEVEELTPQLLRTSQ